MIQLPLLVTKYLASNVFRLIVLSRYFSFFSEYAKMYFYTLFLKDFPRKHYAKDETFRNAFSQTYSYAFYYYFVMGNLKLKLGACQGELFHLALG